MLTRRTPLRRTPLRRQSPRRAAVRAADDAWRAAVLARDNHHCRRCPATYWLDAHHIAGRSYRRTRHLIANGLTLCRPCHRWAHANPVAFRAWSERLLGADQIAALWTAARFKG